MSYILDALKKSEEQRNNGKAGAPSYHAQPRPLRKTRYYLFPIMIVMLALLLIAGFYIFENRKKPMSPSITTDETNIERRTNNIPAVTVATKETVHPGLTKNKLALASETALDRTEKKQINNAPFNDEFTRFNKQDIAKFSRETNSKPSQDIKKPARKPILITPSGVTNLFESPSYLKNQIPALDYSSHWYDPNSKNSVIIINNKSYKEGSWINNKIKIEKILQDETIFKIGSDKFKLSSLQNWGS